MKLGIACASGSAKGVFVHGVLSSFGDQGLVADIYAASSSSTIPAGFAAAHRLASLDGANYWKGVNTRLQEGADVSTAIKHGISTVLPALEVALFNDNASRFAVAVSAVLSDEAAELTQGDGARNLGRRLLLSIRNRDNSWASENLAVKLFDTYPQSGELQLTLANLSEVLYATTRMLHAWKDPAWIEGRPYVDASYTCVTPAIELTDLGMDTIIAISPEVGPMYRDFFQSEVIPQSWNGTTIHFVQPKQNLSELGVDYLKATDDGLETAYELGRQMGSDFIESFHN